MIKTMTLEGGSATPTEIILEQISNDSLGFTRQIVAKETAESEPVVLVDLYANIVNNITNQTVNYNINVVNKALVQANFLAVQAEVDKFLADIREKTNGMGIVSL